MDRPHYSAPPKRFGSRGELTEKTWEAVVQGLNKGESLFSIDHFTVV